MIKPPPLTTVALSVPEAEVHAKYTWDIITDKLLDFYTEIRRLHRRR